MKKNFCLFSQLLRTFSLLLALCGSGQALAGYDLCPDASGNWIVNGPRLAGTMCSYELGNPVTFSTGSLDFGSVTLNTQSNSQTLTITNAANYAGVLLIPSTPTISGSGFALSNNTCGTSLTGSASCTLTVTFNPSVTGTATGTLSIVTSSSTTAYIVNLSGSGAYAVPGAPTAVTATVGNGTATIIFSPPANNGGSPITGYQIGYTSGTSTSITALSSIITGSPATITGLTSGTSYSFVVKAINSGGAGAWSSASNNVTSTGPGNQTVSFGTAPTITTGGTGAVSATATSGLPVTYSSTTPTVCAVSGSTVTGIAAGTCTIAANQAGNASYNAAPQVTQNITIGKANQTVSFGNIPAVVIGGTGTVTATATSGLPVTYSSATPSVCTVSGSTVTGGSAGTCIIAADQAGNANYTAAPQVTQNITVGTTSQVINWGPVQTATINSLYGGVMNSGPPDNNTGGFSFATGSMAQFGSSADMMIDIHGYIGATGIALAQAGFVATSEIGPTSYPSRQRTQNVGDVFIIVLRNGQHAKIRVDNLTAGGAWFTYSSISFSYMLEQSGTIVATPISDARLFAYAEANYPSLFTGTATTGQYQQYNYRHYPASGNYLAIDTAGVISIMGTYTGGALTTIGSVESFRSYITAWETTSSSNTSNASGLAGMYWCVAPTFSVGGTINLLADGTYEMNGAAGGHYSVVQGQVHFDGTLASWNNGVARLEGTTMIFEWTSTDGWGQYFAYRKGS